MDFDTPDLQNDLIYAAIEWLRLIEAETPEQETMLEALAEELDSDEPNKEVSAVRAKLYEAAEMLHNICMKG